jgi:hypothetical protein
VSSDYVKDTVLELYIEKLGSPVQLQSKEGLRERTQQDGGDRRMKTMHKDRVNGRFKNKHICYA